MNIIELKQHCTYMQFEFYTDVAKYLDTHAQ